MKQYNFFKIAVLSSILLIGTTGCEDFLTKASPILLPERLHFVSAFSLHRDNGR